MASGFAYGQSAGTPPSLWNCEEGSENYMWPEIPSPCPEVLIKQKHDHTSIRRYRQQGWDTVVDCNHPEITLTCTPNIPARRFSGTYYVDEIAYNPPDPTFALGTRMPITTDDNFSNMSTNIPYPFYFFGIQKTSFVLGANGLVAFGPVPVTNTTGTGPSCPWSYSAPIPWTDGATGVPNNLNYMRDAIYGIYEDTYPSTSAHSTGEANWGIYYGVQDQYPCRKIICSWNDVPQFSCTSLHCSYQIVCYEGSNIIEVHVKDRNVCTSWQNGVGTIGIQNATGTNQVYSGNPQLQMTSVTGKPAAFFPSGFNTFNTSIHNRAWRFTPTGQTAKVYGWYRISEQTDTTWTNFRLDTTWTEYRFDTVWTSSTDYHFDTVWTSATDYHFDTVWTGYQLDTTWTDYRLNTHFVNDTLRNIDIEYDAVNDEAGYMYPMHDDMEDYPCKYLTKAIISPKKPCRYVFFLNFRNANNDWYFLADTISVGVDTVDYLNLHKSEIKDGLPSKLDICIGDTARMRVDMNKLQDIIHEEWKLFRVTGGNTIPIDTLIGEGQPMLNNNYLTIDNYRMIEAFRVRNHDTIVLDTTLFTAKDYTIVGDTIKTRAMALYSNRVPSTGLQANKIDTLILQISAYYSSGCQSFDTMMIRVFPIFDTINTAEICQGDSYLWPANNRTYTENTNPTSTFVKLKSQPGCDSTVHLKLIVYDVSFSVYHVDDCKPYTWIDENGNGNGKTYSTGNAATAEFDTIVLKNHVGCDSVVQLDFVLHPLTAILRSDVDHFSIDNLNAVLTDVSIGGASRIWRFPGSTPDQMGSTAYYTIPASMEGAKIYMIEKSEYGCVDTAKIYIPLNKETFWMPNAFTPDNPAGNNLFGSKSTKTLYQEMRIYNRRGEMVFRCEGVDCAWDGRDMNGNPCIQGAYVYIIRYTNEFYPKETQVLKGTVTLIR